MQTPRSTEIILHIVEAEVWETARAHDSYSDPSLASEGFIHCSTPQQVLIPANERFAGRRGLLLLVIDPALLSEELIYEDCYESGHRFPHIYGPINRSAVIDEVPFPCNPDGTFSLPVELDQS